MKKYNLSEIMKRAWGIKKEDSENIFSICLKMAWAEAKSRKMEKVLLNKGFKVWTGGKNRRIYINGIKGFERIGLETYSDECHSQYIQLRKSVIYFDENTSAFVLDSDAKCVKEVKLMIADLEKEAYAA